MQLTSTRKKARNALTAIVLSLTLLASTVTTTLPVYAATSANSVTSAVTFENTAKDSGDNAISLTSERTFQAEVKVDSLSQADLETAIKNGQVTWTLSRTKGMQDPKLFPYQYLGGKLQDWKTIKSDIQPQQPMFTDIQNAAVEKDGSVYLKLNFSNKSLFGYDGIDNRNREMVRDTILDYTGPYDLECSVNGESVGKTSVEVRPYDSFHTQSEIDSEMDNLAKRANQAGIYGEVKQYGVSADGRPMRALFIAASKQDLADHLALNQRAETDPEEVKNELDAGTLKYKVPVMYSNVHADEVVASDGCIDFGEALVEAAEKNGQIPYKKIDSLTADGTAEVSKEMKTDGKTWSKLIQGNVTGVGYIQGNGTFNPTDPETKDSGKSNSNPDASVNLSQEEMQKYYNMENTSLNVKDVLNDVFFILVPSENVDGRTLLTRTGGYGMDLNRDNTYQVLPETQAMTHLISTWDPVSFHEFHGYYTQFQVEPCSPTHEPNAEYDLFINNALKQGENLGGCAIANNPTINSFQMPMRDYLNVEKDGSTRWEEPFDDMSTSYTPQYAFMHGCSAFTVELPYGSQNAVTAIKYGCIGNADFVSQNKKTFYENQLEFFRRGVENANSDQLIDKYYVDQNDTEGADAQEFRKEYKGNGNFFPEYYVIPMDASVQKNTKSAEDMVNYLLRNDVRLKVLDKDVTVTNAYIKNSATVKEVQVPTKTYKKGTIIVDMHQAERNMANTALYTDIVIPDWGSLYSEPLTAFAQLRGFDMDTVTTKGAFNGTDMNAITSAPTVTSQITAGYGGVTILSNNGTDAVKAVNDLLRAGDEVGMITEGANKGDFAVKTADFNTVKNKYILTASETNSVPAAKVITKALKLYIPGRVAEFQTYDDGKPYGSRDHANRLNTDMNWDFEAYGRQLGFDIVDNPDDADVIVGNQALSEHEEDLIKNGKPYIGYRLSALKAAKDDFKIGLDYVSEYDDWDGDYDALTTVSYGSDSLITAKYAADKDDIMYGHDGNYITKVPDGAQVLIKTTNDYPIEGFMPADWIENYKNTVQAINYDKDGYHMTLFANTMTNKAHQQDDYRYVTNAIYSRALGNAFTFSSSSSESDSHHGSGSSVSSQNTNSQEHTYVSDTTLNLNVNGNYIFKITSKNGKAPVFVVGTAGVFKVRLIKKVGDDYYYQIIAVGMPGTSTGIYINGEGKLLVATVKTGSVWCDTTNPFHIKKGASYVFKLKADAKPAFVCGTGSVFQVYYVSNKGNEYYYRVKAAGEAGSCAGFYINGEKTPRAVATVQ